MNYSNNRLFDGCGNKWWEMLKIGFCIEKKVAINLLRSALVKENVIQKETNFTLVLDRSLRFGVLNLHTLRRLISTRISIWDDTHMESMKIENAPPPRSITSQIFPPR